MNADVRISADLSTSPNTSKLLAIDDPRSHPAEVVQKLRLLLDSAAPAREDSRRRNFFEVEDADSTFYIYVSPATKRVTLLATWAREPEPAADRAA